MKTHLYFVPGLSASTKIFDFLTLPKDVFELHFLEWLLPLYPNETIENYAERMCEYIKHENFILIGVSFGGVMVQEMSKIISPKKTIIISSIKSREELPPRLKIAHKTKAYKLFPSKIIENIEDYEFLFFTNFLKKRIDLYKIYLSVRNADYLRWSIHTILNWQQEKPLSNIVHIQGTDDEIFPIKYIKTQYIPVEKGTHIMILNRAKTISKIIEKECEFD